jgi:hypothetical protein
MAEFINYNRGLATAIDDVLAAQTLVLPLRNRFIGHLPAF